MTDALSLFVLIAVVLTLAVLLCRWRVSGRHIPFLLQLMLFITTIYVAYSLTLMHPLWHDPRLFVTDHDSGGWQYHISPTIECAEIVIGLLTVVPVIARMMASEYAYHLAEDQYLAFLLMDLIFPLLVGLWLAWRAWRQRRLLMAIVHEQAQVLQPWHEFRRSCLLTLLAVLLILLPNLLAATFIADETKALELLPMVLYFALMLVAVTVVAVTFWHLLFWLAVILLGKRPDNGMASSRTNRTVGLAHVALLLLLSILLMPGTMQRLFPEKYLDFRFPPSTRKLILEHKALVGFENRSELTASAEISPDDAAALKQKQYSWSRTFPPYDVQPGPDWRSEPPLTEKYGWLTDAFTGLQPGRRYSYTVNSTGGGLGHNWTRLLVLDEDANIIYYYRQTSDAW